MPRYPPSCEVVIMMRWVSAFAEASGCEGGRCEDLHGWWRQAARPGDGAAVAPSPWAWRSIPRLELLRRPVQPEEQSGRDRFVSVRVAWVGAAPCLPPRCRSLAVADRAIAALPVGRTVVERPSPSPPPACRRAIGDDQVRSPPDAKTNTLR